MKHLQALLFLAFVLSVTPGNPGSEGFLPSDRLILDYDFSRIDTGDWVVESEAPVGWDELAKNEVLDINASGGITIWYREKLSGNVAIEFEATVVAGSGPNDRVSDLNCFWMATDPENPDDFFAGSEWRNGIFHRYYTLNLYYVGLGGHDNTRTRFRKYHSHADPVPEVIREYTDSVSLIHPNVRSTVRIECRDSCIQYFYNGQKLFELEEEQPYREGYFGFRTVNNHMMIHDFRIYRLEND